MKTQVQRLIDCNAEQVRFILFYAALVAVVGTLYTYLSSTLLAMSETPLFARTEFAHPFLDSLQSANDYLAFALINQAFHYNAVAILVPLGIWLSPYSRLITNRPGKIATMLIFTGSLGGLAQLFQYQSNYDPDPLLQSLLILLTVITTVPALLYINLVMAAQLLRLALPKEEQLPVSDRLQKHRVLFLGLLLGFSIASRVLFASVLPNLAMNFTTDVDSTVFRLMQSAVAIVVGLAVYALIVFIFRRLLPDAKQITNAQHASAFVVILMIITVTMGLCYETIVPLADNSRLEYLVAFLVKFIQMLLSLGCMVIVANVVWQAGGASDV